MRDRKQARYLILAAASAALAVMAATGLTAPSAASAATAGAASGSAAPALSSGPAVTRAAPMHVIRVTRLVRSTPDKAGDVTVQLANGAVIPIPAADQGRVMSRAAQQAKSSPDGVVVGNCGTSNIELAEMSDDHPVRMTTGFTVDDYAIAYGWLAQITGPSFSYTYTASGTLDFDLSWAGSYNSPQDQRQGTYKAAVQPEASFAELWDGDICFSGGPTASKFLTSPDTPISMPLVTNGPLRHATPSVGAGLDISAPEPAGTAQIPGFPGTRAPAPTLAPAAKDPLTRVQNTTVYPYRAVVLLEITYRNGIPPTSCTGFLYSDNVVATAGHCLYLGGWAEKVVAIPGNNATSKPFGSCLGTEAFTVTGWVEGPADTKQLYDYGAVKLNCDIGLETGWFGLFTTTAPLVGTNITITGYPADKLPKNSMWTNSGTIAADSQRQLFYSIDTRDGESGAPVYMSGCGGYCALGVHAYAPDATSSMFRATRITSPAFDNYVAWES